jgi:hypothetical protein
MRTIPLAACCITLFMGFAAEASDLPLVRLIAPQKVNAPQAEAPRSERPKTERVPHEAQPSLAPAPIPTVPALERTPAWLERFGPFLRSQLEQLEMLVTGSVRPSPECAQPRRNSRGASERECAGEPLRRR